MKSAVKQLIRMQTVIADLKALANLQIIKSAQLATEIKLPYNTKNCYSYNLNPIKYIYVRLIKGVQAEKR
ncbi:hypothetical protein T02_8014 [Trichinella nativa]|uniref:Uncharacterized protein n=1 Tax=Trichinella nativa TaxID=6335 RepID=A0A0V1LBN5_9BILA|nr:hypothetical protein T02_8014 [Trichinella nativa]